MNEPRDHHTDIRTSHTGPDSMDADRPPVREQPDWLLVSRPDQPSSERQHRHPLPERLNVDPESVDRDLATLVLTVVELLRQLMERQALRRVDQGDLSAEQIEEIGTTLMLLEQRMADLREHFGLTAEDLNIDLGPLGPLLPRQ